ncbi:unnamed protein product [Penicillium manginii]
MQNTGSQKLQLLSRNAQQLLKVAQSTFPSATFDTEAFSDCNPDNLSGIDEIQCTWSQAHKLLSNQQFSDSEEAYPAIEQVLLRFSRATQEVMSSTASNYDMSRLVGGLLILALATSLLLPRIYHEFSQTVSTGIFLVFMVVGYGSMMFASSYVEEEQQFWYWICSGWMFYLHMRSESPQNSSRRKAGSSPFRLIKLATLGLIASHRVLRRWNQTGQKFTAEPDIARDFFPAHPVALWGLVILTYVDSGYHLLANMPASAPAKLIALITPALGFMFKLNFAANDSPELLADTPLSKLAGSWLGSLSLVLQARLVFGGLACCGLLAIVSAKASRSTQISKPNALFHEALHLFLMTQSRITNVPIFLLFRTQGVILSSLNLTGIEVTATTLILQYMTFFAFGGSNSISSVDLSSAYNGVGSYSVVGVGILTFVSNWAGPVWWISKGHLLRPRTPPSESPEGEKHDSAALFTFQVAASLLSVMAACTALRTHLFIWTVFSPKYLYSMAWATANHVAVNILGGIGLACLWPRR